MGWNQLAIRRPTPILRGLDEGTYVYFVHSYYVTPEDRNVIAAETDYGGPFCSMIAFDNVFATQFHPERASRTDCASSKLRGTVRSLVGQVLRT